MLKKKTPVVETPVVETPVWEGYPSRDFKTPIAGFVVPGKEDTSEASTQETNTDVDAGQE